MAAKSWVSTQTAVAVSVFLALFALLFQYRILSLLKRLGANVNPIGTKLPINLDFPNAPQWLLPFYHTLDYLNIVWFTTLLGLFIAGAMIAFVPDILFSRLRGNGLKQNFVAALLGIPNMLCTCCAASPLAGLRKAGASFGPALTFFVTAPALNIVVIILAFEMLPLKLALARLLLGVVAALGVTSVVAKLIPDTVEEYGPATESRREATIGQLMRRWLLSTWDVVRTVVPLLLAGMFVIGVFKTAFSFETVAKQFGEGIVPTLAAAVLGTVLMVPTFTEVIWVSEFTKQGMGIGPAVALLITLPAVSFPSLWVAGRVLRSYKVAVTLGVLILGLGVAGGAVFSMV